MAFIKETGRNVDGKEYRYQHLVRSYKDAEGITRHEYLANLSDAPESVIQSIKDGLDENKTTVETQALEPEIGDSLQGAGQLSLWRAWEKTDMDRVLKGFSDKQIESIKAMVFSRITGPTSKLALKDELADTVLAKLFSTNRLDEDTLYEVMDELYEQFGSIQENLQEIHLNEEPRLILYDTTSTYFEGTCAEGGEHGNSKDHRPDRYQIIIGIITNGEGLPIAVEVFDGDTHDASTVNNRIEALREDFGFQGVVFVGDKGMYGKENIETIEEAGFDYIMSLAWKSQKKRLQQLAPEQLELFDEQGYYEFEEDGARYVGCCSKARKQRAKKRRERAVKQVNKKLEKWAQSARKGTYYTKLRLYEKVQNLLKKNGVQDLYTVNIQTVEDGVDEETKARQNLQWSLDKLAVDRREALEGKYILQTSLESEEKTSEEVEETYRRLHHVEKGFKTIKSFLKIRPIYHRLNRRIRAHVLICFLAYFLVKWIEQRLREAGEDREVKTVINKWDQLELVKHRLEVQDYVNEDYSWSRGEVGRQVVEEIREVGWWKSIQGYQRGITKKLLEVD